MSLDLKSDETIAFSIAANRSQGAITRGGRLTLTSARVIFVPNSLDRWLGAKRWEAPIAAIRELGVQSRSWGLLDGGLRGRLRVAMQDGSTELFVVPDAIKTAWQIERTLVRPS